MAVRRSTSRSGARSTASRRRPKASEAPARSPSSARQRPSRKRASKLSGRPGDGADAGDGGGPVAGELGEGAGELELGGVGRLVLATREGDGAGEEIEGAAIAAGGAERAREADDGVDVVRRVAEGALEERGRVHEEAAREEGGGGAAKDGVARVGAARGGLEVIDVGLGAAEIGEVEAQLEASPAHEIERGRAGDGVVEGVEALAQARDVTLVVAELRVGEPEERRERSVGLGAGAAGEGDARAVMIADRGEELPAERAGVDSGQRVDERGERPLGAAPGDGVDPREPLRDLGVTRGALEDGEVTMARVVEIAGEGRGVGLAGELGQLEGAEAAIRELGRRRVVAGLEDEAPELGDGRVPAHRGRRGSARAGRGEHLARELRGGVGDQDRAADGVPERSDDGAERAHGEHLRRRAEPDAARARAGCGARRRWARGPRRTRAPPRRGGCRRARPLRSARGRARGSPRRRARAAAAPPTRRGRSPGPRGPAGRARRADGESARRRR